MAAFCRWESRGLPMVTQLVWQARWQLRWRFCGKDLRSKYTMDLFPAKPRTWASMAQAFWRSSCPSTSPRSQCQSLKELKAGSAEGKGQLSLEEQNGQVLFRMMWESRAFSFIAFMMEGFLEKVSKWGCLEKSSLYCYPSCGTESWEHRGSCWGASRTSSSTFPITNLTWQEDPGFTWKFWVERLLGLWVYQFLNFVSCDTGVSERL